MEVPLKVVMALVLGVTVFMILSYLTNSFINGSEQTVTGWLP